MYEKVLAVSLPADSGKTFSYIRYRIASWKGNKSENRPEKCAFDSGVKNSAALNFLPPNQSPF